MLYIQYSNNIIVRYPSTSRYLTRVNKCSELYESMSGGAVAQSISFVVDYIDTIFLMINDLAKADNQLLVFKERKVGHCHVIKKDGLSNAAMINKNTTFPTTSFLTVKMK